jgi:Zinc finger, C3HC4 type (RING finger)
MTLSLHTTEVMTGVRSPGFSSKRIKLEDNEDLLPTHDDSEGVEPNQDDLENSCSICLHSIADLTVIPKCSHEFCFECLLVWTGMSSSLLERYFKWALFIWRTISSLPTMFTSHRRVFDTLHQIAVRLSKAFSTSLTVITTSSSSCPNDCRSDECRSANHPPETTTRARMGDTSKWVRRGR